ncbi:alpha/beta fold hydrolase, partial [bacterium]|nr:alpha/beta fold hydrolase [bacterium]
MFKLQISSLLLIALFSSCSLMDLENDNSDPWEKTKYYVTPLYTIAKFPKHYKSTQQVPLLIALHGNGDTADAYVKAFSSYADQGLILAIPQGAYQVENGGFSWFYFTEDRTLWEQYDTLSVQKLMSVIRGLKELYSITETYILGFSQGASLAYMTGLLYPSEINGILAISGSMPEIDQPGSIVHAEDIIAAQDVKLFIAQGTHDNPKDAYT